MMRMFKNRILHWIWPLIAAVLIFACIRFAEDIPKGADYWQGKSIRFIMIDFGGVVVVCYVFMYLIEGWISFNIKHNIGIWFEYGVLIASVFLLCLVEMLISWKMNNRMYGIPDIAVPAIVSILFICLFYGFKRREIIDDENKKLQLNQEKMKAEQLRTELKLLRSQFHPHFLFNILNTVYFQIDENNNRPRRTIELLSDILRYQIYNEGNPVSISTEIDYLNKYISLWKMRCSEKLQLKFDIDTSILDCKVYPMLFLPIIENAFKYLGGEYIINITLSKKGNNIVFITENSTHEFIPKVKNSGVGLDNLRKRLSILYPNKHSLITEHRNKKFFAEIILMP